MDNYRSRIYRRYVHARHETLAPKSLEHLKPRSHLFKRIIRKHFPEDKNALILDLGCGHGAFLFYIQQAGYANSYGIDTSPEQVAEAARLGIKGVRKGEICKTLSSTKGKTLEVVVTFDVIEHFTKQELTRFTDEVRRCLKVGGKWIIHTPNGESPFGSRMFFGDFTHEVAFTRVSIAQFLKASGFTHVFSEEDTPVPHGIRSVVRWALWKAVRALVLVYFAIETGSFERDSILTQNFVTVAVK